MLEDVHWADAASLDVLRILGRRVEGTGAFVLATFRDDEVTGDHPLRVVLGARDRQGRVTPLSAAALARRRA